FLEESAGEESAPKEDFLSGKSILLLQYEDIDRTLVEVMLKKLGCHVVSVADPEAAMNALSTLPFDAFISESHLHDIDIKHFIESSKVTNQKCHNNAYRLPILGFSQKEHEGEETHCLQSGMNYYIDSPLQIDDLRAILRRWIGRAIHMAEQADSKDNQEASK
ncbi:MAG: hypothetical protein AAFZ92_09455, partial [Pseudomonadota bacterium]